MKEQNEKQAIEEMAKVLCEDYGNCYNCIVSNPESEGACNLYSECETVYNAGYRKQSVGEWVWADDGYCRCSVCTQKAPVTTQYQDEPMTTATKYCPWCGAKMKGKNDERVH